MQKFAKVAVMLVLTALLVAPLTADDDEKKKKRAKRGKNQVAGQLMKRLEKAGLDDEQTAKVKEIVGKYGPKIMEARKAISADIRKKQAAIGKKLRADGKKGKELQAAIKKELGLDEDELKAYEEAQAKLTGLTREMTQAVAAVLTPEQRKQAKLRVGKAKAKKKGKGKKKKKKDDA